jgi:hypothetical protein
MGHGKAEQLVEVRLNNAHAIFELWFERDAFIFQGEILTHAKAARLRFGCGGHDLNSL